jgi:hypothetical protein
MAEPLAGLCTNTLLTSCFAAEHGLQEPSWEVIRKNPEALAFLTNKILAKAEPSVLIVCTRAGWPPSDMLLIHARMSELPRWFRVYLEFLRKHAPKDRLRKANSEGVFASGGVQVDLSCLDAVPSFYEYALETMQTPVETAWQEFLQLFHAMGFDLDERFGPIESWDDSMQEFEQSDAMKDEEDEPSKDKRFWHWFAKTASDVVSETVAENLEQKAKDTLNREKMKELAADVETRRRIEGPDAIPSTPVMTITIDHTIW